MRIVKLSLLLLFIGCCSAGAGELDTYYLQQFGEVTADSARTALKNVQVQTARKCGMPLRRDLKRDWKMLEAGTQRTLSKYLGLPALINERIVTSNGNHFKIHYASTGTDAPPAADTNNNGIPDWIEKVADVFEAVYNREIVQMGYRVPPAIPCHVYLKNMADFGVTESDTLNGQSATSFITIENDFAEHPFQTSIPGNDPADIKSLKALQITAAHEFHHAIQFGYNFFFEAWYAEATATWIEDEVYDSVNQLYAYPNSPQGYLASTSASLNSGPGYDRWIFNRFLYEQFYSQDIIRKIWDTFSAEPAVNNNDIPMLPFIDRVLKANNGLLASSFFGFVKQTYLRNWISHTNELSRFNQIASSAVSADTSYLLINPVLPTYSFTYYQFTHATNSASTLTINYPDKPANYAVIAFKNSDRSEYTYDAVSKAVTIPGFGPSDSIFLLVCNNGDGTPTVVPTPPAGPITSPPDATNPNTAPPTPVPTPTPPAASGGGGGGCFIATAAYGSYLHPEVMTLRDFRDRHLLSNVPGRAFVAFYYRTSPPIADFIREHESARFIVRIFLAPVIFMVKHLWTTGAALSVLACLAFFRFRKRPALRIAAEH